MEVIPYPANIPRGTPICSKVIHVVALSPPNLSIQTGKYTSMKTWKAPVKNLLNMASQMSLLNTNISRETHIQPSPIRQTSLELNFW